MKTVIFACVHEAGRSQMAAAFFNQLADPARLRSRVETLIEAKGGVDAQLCRLWHNGAGMKRFVAALLASWVVAVASAGAVVFCAGWSPSAADRHDCCKEMLGRRSSSTTDGARECCAMGEQSSSRAPIEARVSAPALAVAIVTPLLATPVGPTVAVVSVERSTPASPPSAPLFLVQRALLI